MIKYRDIIYWILVSIEHWCHLQGENFPLAKNQTGLWLYGGGEFHIDGPSIIRNISQIM